MTKQEFTRKSRAAKGQMSLLVAMSAFYLSIVLVVLLWPAVGIINESNRGLIIGVAVLVVAADYVAATVILQKTVARKNGLVCPKCGLVFPAFASSRIIEENACPRCRETLYDPAAGAPEGLRLIR